MTLKFTSEFDPRHGEPVEVAPGVVRVIAPNASPFTFHGTNSYIVGTDTLAVIDPGPENEVHLDALLAAIGGRPVSHILITHTHRDHSPLAARLKELTGAKTAGEGPHRYARAPRADETVRLDASGDQSFVPDIVLADGCSIEGDGWALSAITTPGHAANHLAFELADTGTLFSGDHVMGWSTTIVAPPDGSMTDYMASLEKLIHRHDELLLPGHGDAITAPRAFLRGLRSHRKMRARAIVERLRQGDRSIADMVANIYRDTDPRLHKAAALSVLAHLEDLVARGMAVADPVASLDADYSIA